MPTSPVFGENIFSGENEFQIELFAVGDGKEISAMTGRNSNFCPWCKCPYFTHPLIPENQNDLAANDHPKTTLVESLDQSAGFLNEVKTKKPNTALRAKYNNYISEPFFKTLEFENIMVCEFHTLINNAKRVDNRSGEMTKDMDAVLKCKLIQIEDEKIKPDFAKWNEIVGKLKSDPTDEKLKKSLKDLRGPTEKMYNELLQKNNIRVSTFHGRAFNGDNSYKMLQSPEIYDFLKPQKYENVVLGNEYVRKLYVSYLNNLAITDLYSRHPRVL